MELDPNAFQTDISQPTTSFTVFQFITRANAVITMIVIFLILVMLCVKLYKYLKKEDSKTVNRVMIGCIIYMVISFVINTVNELMMHSGEMVRF